MNYEAERTTPEYDIEALQVEGEWVKFLFKGRYKWVQKTDLNSPHFNPERYKQLTGKTTLKGSGKDRSTAKYERYLSVTYENETVYVPEQTAKLYEEDMFEWKRYFNRLDTEINADKNVFYRGVQAVTDWITNSAADRDGDIIYDANPAWKSGRETVEFRKFKRTIVCKHPLEFDKTLYTEGGALKKLVWNEFGWPRDSDKVRYFRDEVAAIDIWGDIAGEQIGGVQFQTNSFWFAHPVYFLNHLYMAGLLGQRIFVSHDQLKRLGWNNITDKMVNELNRVLDIYEITTPSSICHFLSQCYIESDRGKAPAEYGDGSRYENRIDIGNVETGDGPKFKGGGYIQLTGRNNYTVFSNAMKDPKILDEGSAYVAVYYPWESAAFFWTKITNLNVRANNGASVTEITKVVNGGYAALEERKDAYNKCLQVIY